MVNSYMATGSKGVCVFNFCRYYQNALQNLCPNSVQEYLSSHASTNTADSMSHVSLK